MEIINEICSIPFCTQAEINIIIKESHQQYLKKKNERMQTILNVNGNRLDISNKVMKERKVNQIIETSSIPAPERKFIKRKVLRINF